MGYYAMPVVLKIWMYDMLWNNEVLKDMNLLKKIACNTGVPAGNNEIIDVK